MFSLCKNNSSTDMYVVSTTHNKRTVVGWTISDRDLSGDIELPLRGVDSLKFALPIEMIFNDRNNEEFIR